MLLHSYATCKKIDTWHNYEVTCVKKF